MNKGKEITMAATGREHKAVMRRIHYIDEKISAGRYPNATSLAKELECNARTIQRDIEYMKDSLYAPLEYDHTKKGYYYTEPNFHLKGIPISEGELFALGLAQPLLQQYKNTPIEKQLSAIFEKIESRLPENVQLNSGISSANLTFIANPIPLIDEEVFKTVFDALKNHKTLTFDYRPLQKSTYMNRTVEPFHAVCQKGNWYLICREINPPKENNTVHPSGDIRNFALSRIKNPVETKNQFAVPKDFDVNNYFDSETGVWLSDTKPILVELEFSSEVGTFALDRIWHKDQVVKEKADGSVYVSFKTTQLREVVRFVLGQGHTVKVLGPEELRAAVVDEARIVAEMYEEEEK